jgi:cellulose biosynthesis protein BcsQ
MSLNITIVAKKGGVGKSTVSLLLCEAFRQAGKTVAVHDWDPQGTSTKALELINRLTPKVDGNADIVIWDTPPDLRHTATATAVRNANLVLVITTPALADVWEADEAVRFAKSRNDKAIIRVIFNKQRKGTVLGRLVEESAKEMSAPSLRVVVSDRECYKHAVAQGWKALDSSAREEVLQLAVALLSLEI